MTQHSNTDSTTDRNFSQAELDKFGALANRWWDPQGPQKALHALNPARLGYVSARTALPGAQVLDVGCGAGLLSEAMAGEGAQVVALDLAPELIKIARLHRLETGVSVDYRLQSVESLAVEMPGRFDAITCMELLEHVPDPASIIDACATLLKPGGKLFVSTVNRTPAAFALAIVGAEYIARLLPRGTHQYRDFIKPSELGAWLRAAALRLEDVSGLMYEPWRNAARVIARTDVNYLACASRPVIEGPDCGEPDCGEHAVGEHAVRKEREGAQKKTEARLFSRVLRPSRTVFSTDSATLAGVE